MIKKIIFFLFVINMYAYQICESYIGNSYYVSCLNGVEYLRYDASHGVGLAKTGHKCKCVLIEGFLEDSYKVERIK